MKVTACLTVDDEELVVEGEVMLPRILDHHAFDRAEVLIARAYTDTPPHPEPRNWEGWTEAQVVDASYALFQAACNEVLSCA